MVFNLYLDRMWICQWHLIHNNKAAFALRHAHNQRLPVKMTNRNVDADLWMEPKFVVFSGLGCRDQKAGMFITHLLSRHSTHSAKGDELGDVSIATIFPDNVWLRNREMLKTASAWWLSVQSSVHELNSRLRPLADPGLRFNVMRLLYPLRTLTTNEWNWFAK